MVVTLQYQFTKHIHLMENVIKELFPDATDIQLYKGKYWFKSKGVDKRTKTCVATFDSLGIKVVVKQIEFTKKISLMVNGYPISNCKIVFER